MTVLDDNGDTMPSDPQTPSSPRGEQRANRSGACTILLFGLAIAWAVATGLYAYAQWPHIPMDISANDPATRAAFDGVVRQHVITHVIVGLLPLVVCVGLIPLLCGRQRAS